MTIANLTDQALHQNLMDLKSKESHIVALIISHIEEVYRRRLFADFGCSSIYDYCIRILGYSNGEAHKKISACKLASQVSGVRESIASGELSLSNAASAQMLVAKIQNSISIPTKSVPTAQTTIKEIRHSHPELIHSIVERVKNKSTRECERELHKIAQEQNLDMPRLKSTRRNINDLAQLKVCVNRENLDALKLEMGITSEQELIEGLIADKLTQLRAAKKSALDAEVKAGPHKVNARPRSISRSKRAIVIKRAEGKCENCGTSSRLEIDHKQAVAIGGGNDIGNLRVLCRSCNQRAAIQKLGLDTMEPYISMGTSAQTSAHTSAYTSAQASTLRDLRVELGAKSSMS